jgi:hypothetical protein
VEKFLEEFFEKVSAVELDGGEGQEPEDDVREGENVIGVLPDRLKKMHIVLREESKVLSDQCQEFHKNNVELIISNALAELTKVMQQCFLLHARHKIFSEIFWHSVTEVFPQSMLLGEVTGLRKGWKVVSFSRLDTITSLILGNIFRI